MNVNLPELTQEEKQAIAPAVSMLGPFSGKLRSTIDSPSPDAVLARELGGYIPPTLYDSTIALCKIVKTKGVEVLGYINPSLPHPRWASILEIMGRELSMVLNQGEE